MHSNSLIKVWDTYANILIDTAPFLNLVT